MIEIYNPLRVGYIEHIDWSYIPKKTPLKERLYDLGMNIVLIFLRVLMWACFATTYVLLMRLLYD